MKPLFDWRLVLVFFTAFSSIFVCIAGEVPSTWSCNPVFYGSGDGCDCGCGAWDPDCRNPLAVVYGCISQKFNTISCNSDGTCNYLTPPHIPGIPPASWFCYDGFYDSLDGCDCDCGAWDPDCSVPSQVLFGCEADDSGCIFPGVCNVTASTNVPTSWTCDPEFYGSNDGCDCDCGDYDPDCASGGIIYGCSARETCDALGVCQPSAGVCTAATNGCSVASGTCLTSEYILDGLSSSLLLDDFGPVLVDKVGTTLAVDYTNPPNCLSVADYSPTGSCFPYTSTDDIMASTGYCEDFSLTPFPNCVDLSVPINSSCTLDGSGAKCRFVSSSSIIAPTLSSGYQSNGLPESYFWYERSIPQLPYSLSPPESLLSTTVQLALEDVTVEYDSVAEKLVISDGSIEVHRETLEGTNFSFWLTCVLGSSVELNDVMLTVVGCPLYLNRLNAEYQSGGLITIDSSFWMFNSNASFDTYIIIIEQSSNGSTAALLSGIHFIDTSVTFQDSTIRINGVFDYNSQLPNSISSLQSTTLKLTDTTSNLILVGVVDFIDSNLFAYGGLGQMGSLNSTQRSIVSLSESDLVMFNTNVFFTLKVFRATVLIMQSKIMVLGGSIITYETSLLSLSDSEVDISETLHLTDYSVLRANASLIKLFKSSNSTSLLRLSKYAVASAYNSVILIGGDLNLDDSGQLQFTECKLLINNRGNLFLNGSTTFSTASGSVVVQGKVSATSQSKLNLLGTNINVGGDIRLSGGSSLTLSFGQLLIDKGGSYYFNDQSTATIVSSSITLSGDVIIRDNATLTMSTGCSLTISLGTLKLLDSSVLKLYNASLLRLQGGNLIANDKSELWMYDTSRINVIYGVVMFSGFATLGFDNSAIAITVLPNRVFGDYFRLIEYRRVRITNKSVLIVDGGNLYMADASLLTLEKNSLGAIRNGSIRAVNYSTIASTDSLINITGGSVDLYDRTSLLLSRSHFVVSSEGLQDSVLLSATGNSNLSISNISSIHIIAGGMSLDQNASVSLSASSLVILGGDLKFYRSASLAAQRRSSINVRKGTIEFHSNSSLEAFAKSSITISGGSMFLLDSSRLSLQPSFEQKSARDLSVDGLAIQMGSLVLTSDSQLLSNGATIKITGGSLLTMNFSTIIMSDSDIKIKAGSFVSGGSSVVVLKGSELAVVGGEVTTAERSLFIVDGSATVDIHGGDFNVEGRSTVQIQDRSTLYVTSGSLIVSEDAIMLFNSSSGVVRGGDLEVKDRGYLQLVEKSSLRIITGQVSIQGDARVILKDNSFISNGEKIIGGGSFEMPSKTSYEITSSGYHEITESLSIAPPEGEKEGGSVLNEGYWVHSLSKGIHSIGVGFTQRGTARFSDGRVSVMKFVQTSGRTTFDSATMESKENPVAIEGGFLTGFGEIEGEVTNNGELTHGDRGLLLKIKGNYKQQKGKFSVLLDNKEPGTGFSQIAVEGEAALDSQNSVISICVGERLKKGDRFDVMTFNKLIGKFSEVRLECDENYQKKRSKRDSTETQECLPTVEYGTNSIAVLLASCGDPNASFSLRDYEILSGCLLLAMLIIAILIGLASVYIAPVHVWIYGYDKKALDEKVNELRHTINRATQD